MSAHDSPATEATVAQLRSIPWVTYVGETDREDATHRVETDRSVIRRRYEIHTLENCPGVRHEATSCLAPNARIYISIEP